MVEIECQKCNGFHEKRLQTLIRAFENNSQIRCSTKNENKNNYRDQNFIKNIVQYYLKYDQIILTELDKVIKINSKLIEVECHSCNDFHVRSYRSLIFSYLDKSIPICILRRGKTKRKEEFRKRYDQSKLVDKGLELSSSNVCKVYLCDESIDYISDLIESLHNFEFLLDPYEVAKVLNRRLYKFNKHHVSHEIIGSLALFFSSPLLFSESASLITSPTIRAKFMDLRFDKVFVHPYLYREYLFLKFWNRTDGLVGFRKFLNKIRKGEIGFEPKGHSVLTHMTSSYGGGKIKQKYYSSKCKKESSIHKEICGYCGTEFVTSRSHKKYCSSKCKKESSIHKEICGYCGTEFVVSKFYRKYCSRCKEESSIHKEICGYCGTEFVTSRSHKKYCSSECKVEINFVEENSSIMTITEIESLLRKRFKFSHLSNREIEFIQDYKDSLTFKQIQLSIGNKEYSLIKDQLDLL
jgi:uncharacterized Zn-finger protein